MNSPTPPMNRRSFLRTTAAGALAASSLVSVAAEEKKLRLGLIGAGCYHSLNLT